MFCLDFVLLVSHRKRAVPQFRFGAAVRIPQFRFGAAVRIPPGVKLLLELGQALITLSAYVQPSPPPPVPCCLF